MINICIGALIFSIWCILLFFGKSIGLSMFLFIAPLTYFIICMLEKNKRIENSKAKIFIIPIILLASTYFIFNNKFFNTINIFVIPILIMIMILELFNEKIKLNSIVGRILEMFFNPLNFVGETLAKLRDGIENKLKINIDNRDTQKIKKVIRGICITLPIVLVIIGLLSSADEIFGNIFTEMMKNVVNIICKIKVSTVLIKILLIIVGFIYLLCFFDYIVNRYEKDNDLKELNNKEKDNLTIKMVLGTLNIVYLVFCIIQIKSLFMRDVDIIYSKYARQGFFQLMIVSIINLITILISKKSENKKSKYINIMSLIMIVFTFIILISSAVRMYMYESAYGYTLLRLLVYCALFTETILLIPTIMYVIDKKINLPKVYFIIIITIYVGANFLNFDNMIAKRNVDRYINTGKIDIEYLKYNTGTDAINQIIRILETNIYEDNIKTETERYLKNIYEELDKKDFDFREFNISEIKAKSYLEEINE